MTRKQNLSVRILALKDIAKETDVLISTKEAIKKNRALKIPVHKVKKEKS